MKEINEIYLMESMFLNPHNELSSPHIPTLSIDEPIPGHH